MAKRQKRVEKEMHRLNSGRCGTGWAARQAAKRSEHKSARAGKRNPARTKNFKVTRGK